MECQLPQPTRELSLREKCGAEAVRVRVPVRMRGCVLRAVREQVDGKKTLSEPRPSVESSTVVLKLEHAKTHMSVRTHVLHKRTSTSAHFGSTYPKIGKIPGRLARPLSKEDTQIGEAVHTLQRRSY